MATTPRGIWSPDAGDLWDLTVDLGAMATSVDSAIDDVAAQVSNTELKRHATLAGLVASTPPDGTIAIADDAPGAIFTRAGGAWRPSGGIVSNTPMTAGTPVGTLRFW